MMLIEYCAINVTDASQLNNQQSRQFFATGFLSISQTSVKRQM